MRRPLHEPPDLPFPQLDRLRAAVSEAYAETGADTPSWPDPWSDRDAPPDEAYSRCLDPVRQHRALEARLRAWEQVWTDLGAATVRELDPDQAWTGSDRAPASWSRLRVVEPTRPAALRLVVATAVVDGGEFCLDLGTQDGVGPPVLLSVLPDCGCDACDSGSADLLASLDDWVLTVARGGVVHARRSSRDDATRTLDGWQTSNRGDTRWLDEREPTPADVRRWHGATWV